jgi:hypothetical protein
MSTNKSRNQGETWHIGIITGTALLDPKRSKTASKPRAAAAASAKPYGRSLVVETVD